MKAIVKGQMWPSSKKERVIKEFPRPPSDYPAWMQEEGLFPDLRRAAEPKQPDRVEPRFVTEHRGTEPNTPWSWDRPCSGCGIRVANYSLSWEYPPGRGQFIDEGTFCSAICVKKATRTITADITRVDQTRQWMTGPPLGGAVCVPRQQGGDHHRTGELSKCIPLGIKVVEVGGNTPILFCGQVYFPGYKAPPPVPLQLQGAEPLEKRTRQGDAEDL